MKKAISVCFALVLSFAGSLTGRITRVYMDYTANPLMYEPPYESWQEELKLDFIINGSGIIICIIIILVLKVLIKKERYI